MKKLFTFLSFLLPLITTAQQIIITKDLDTVIQTKTQTQRTIKVGTLTYKDSVIRYDTVIQVVKKYVPPGTVNQPPVTNAGSDFSVTLPATSFQLNGAASYDPDGTIKSYGWRKISGGSATLTDTNKAIATVTNFAVGSYSFELRVVDNLNSFRADTVKVTVIGQTTGNTFQFSVPKNTTFKRRNFSGFENWNGQNYTNFGNGWNDYYFRFVWTDIEKQTQGNYVWTRFDQEFNKAIAVKGKFSFGIMIVCDSDDFLSYETYPGSSAWSRYPKYVHDRMQSESVKDYVTNGQWIPNWNSTFLHDRFDALDKAIQAHIVEKGWQDKINYIDIRGYGQWGEWHSVGFGQPVSSMPAGTRPTVASYKRFVDGRIAAYPNYQLVMLLAALDAEWLDNTMTPREVTDYILKAKNNRGLIGIRRDQWGATDGYVRDYLENNNRNWNGGPAFKTAIMERWKVAPWVGEPMGPGSNLSDLTRQATFYHANSIGNGNYTADATSMNYFRSAEAASGYKLALQSGEITISSSSTTISLSIENFGNTPCYEDYDLVYEIRNSSGAKVASFTSNWKAYLKLPGVHAVAKETWFASIPSGTYSLAVGFKNSYRTMPLFNDGQGSDGFIIVKTGIVL